MGVGKLDQPPFLSRNDANVDNDRGLPRFAKTIKPFRFGFNRQTCRHSSSLRAVRSNPEVFHHHHRRRLCEWSEAINNRHL